MYKLFFLLFLLSSCSNLNQKVSKRVTKANRLPAQTNERTSGFRPSYIGSDIGRIQYSMLTKEQFVLVNGDSWVLMDGKPYQGSDYHKLTGRKNVPDIRGKFTPETVYSFSVYGRSGKRNPPTHNEVPAVIENIVRNSEGHWNIKFKPEFFSSTPSVSVSLLNTNSIVGNGVYAIAVESRTKDYATIVAGYTSGGANHYKDLDFTVFIQRQNNDYILNRNQLKAFIKIKDD
jgi:hypothetical protein